ncbi:MAG: uncharacterized protein A8A55_0675 [Amphiamblys sp. WSBS2006]|nr:MAG: uncharacterized protein A8A55_0675 [Amphiamblys sp. WSBS2006]
MFYSAESVLAEIPDTPGERLSFSPNGSLLAIVDSAGELSLVSMETRNVIYRMSSAKETAPKYVFWSQCGRHLFSVSGAGSVQWWDLAERQSRYIDIPVKSVVAAWRQGEEYTVVGETGETYCFFVCLESRELGFAKKSSKKIDEMLELARQYVKTPDVFCMCLETDSILLSEDSVLKTISLGRRTEECFQEQSGFPIEAFGYTEDGENVYSITRVKEAQRLSLYTRKKGLFFLGSFDFDEYFPLCFAFHPFRPYMAAVCDDETVRIYSARRRSGQWGAVFPNIQQLSANIEYIEKEDEFDICSEKTKDEQTCPEETIDIVAMTEEERRRADFILFPFPE